MMCASHAGEFAHGMFETTHGRVRIPCVRDPVSYIIIPLLDFTISLELKLL
jgi:hypothetical protein